MIREVGEKLGRLPVSKTKRILRWKERPRASMPEKCCGRKGLENVCWTSQRPQPYQKLTSWKEGDRQKPDCGVLGEN